ncbi:MAG: hypothetical protein GY926_22865 [bacterium]|nr:hypothetical protein [bacterium]
MFHSRCTELLLCLERYDEAAEAFRRAISLTSNRNSRSFIEERLADIG